MTLDARRSGARAAKRACEVLREGDPGATTMTTIMYGHARVPLSTGVEPCMMSSPPLTTFGEGMATHA